MFYICISTKQNKPSEYYAKNYFSHKNKKKIKKGLIFQTRTFSYFLKNQQWFVNIGGLIDEPILNWDFMSERKTAYLQKLSDNKKIKKY